MEMDASSHSRSDLLRAVLYGPLIRGEVIGAQDLCFGGYVVSITRPGSPRMPNGIECRLKIRMTDRVAIGGGRLVVGRTTVDPGPEWNPVPEVSLRRRILAAGPVPLQRVSAGESIGAMSFADATLAGYLAGIVLLHGQRDRAARLVDEAATRSNPLTATLLRHAARGEVPEPVHWLLSGEPRDLLAEGGFSGHAWLRGLVSAGYPIDAAVMWGRAVGGNS